MDIVTLGAALNGSAEYVNSHFKGGSNIQIVDNPDGTQTINASGEVSAEDAVARAEIAEMKDGETLDSFGDVETALGDKADTSTTYTKTEVDTALSAKANSADVYSKTAVDTALSNKADKSTTYTKTEVDTSLGNKADKSTTYTKTEVDTALSGKQNAIDDLSTIRSGAALGATAVQPETGKGLSTNDYTTAEKTKLAGIAEGAEVNVQSNWTQTTTTADDYIKNKPTLGTAAAKNATDTYNATGTDVTTGKAVAAALATLPEPMVFKGSLGTGGTITRLPTASSSNKGYVYKVITSGTYASQSAKVGDTFISDGSAWVLIPSGDEPSGTVTNVAVANGGGLTVSGSPITSSGTITVGHSNSVTAKTSSSLKKFTYDEHGHVTGSSELSAAESDALASGIDSAKVEQIETNKNNILSIYNTGFAQKNVMHIVLDEVKAIQSWATFINNTITFGNLSVTFNDDNSITLNGSNTVDVAINFKDFAHINLPTNAVGAASANIALSNDIFFGLWGDSGVPNLVLNNGVDIPSDYASKYSRGFIIRVSANTVCNNVRIYPMVCDKALYQASSEVVPYALSNAELTAKEQANENNILSLYTQGVKNIAKPNTISATSGITIVQNLGHYEISGTTGNSQYTVYLCTPTEDIIATEELYIPAAATRTNVNYLCHWKNTQDESKYSVIGTGLIIPQGCKIHTIYMQAAANTTFSLNVNMMICKKAIYDADNSYQPYAMNNVELTAAIQALQAQLANQ